MISSSALTKIALGAGLGVALSGAGGAGVLALNFSSSLGAKAEAAFVVELGAVALGTVALGYLVGGDKPGTVGRGMMYGAALIPVYMLAVTLPAIPSAIASRKAEIDEDRRFAALTPAQQKAEDDARNERMRILMQGLRGQETSL